MTFDPGYVPQTVDFVVLYDMVRYIDKVDGKFRKLGEEIGLPIRTRQEPESALTEMGTVAGVSIDSVVLIHSDVNHDSIGAVSGIKMAQTTSARVILQVENSRYNDIVKALGSQYSDWDLTPEKQVSFFDELQGILTASGKIKQYFETLAALRGKE